MPVKLHRDKRAKQSVGEMKSLLISVDGLYWQRFFSFKFIFVCADDDMVRLHPCTPGSLSLGLFPIPEDCREAWDR